MALTPSPVTPSVTIQLTMGLGHFPPDISPRTFPPGHFPLELFPTEKNANNVVEIEAGMIKQYF